MHRSEKRLKPATASATSNLSLTEVRASRDAPTVESTTADSTGRSTVHPTVHPTEDATTSAAASSASAVLSSPLSSARSAPSAPSMPSGASTSSVRKTHTIDYGAVKPYGDTFNDGAVQLSFSLPVPYGAEGKEAAKQLVQRIGFTDVQVYHSQDLGEGFSYYVVYGRTQQTVDYASIEVPQVKSRTMTFYEINDYIKRHLGRKVVIIGACTGTDAHTVGIDAIMNMKGYDGEYGLERYPEIEALNMGSQVPNEALIAKALEMNADALLVSQVVTQKDSHVKNLTELVELLEAERVRERFLLICGGPRINHEMALELGYDAGFGPGTLAPMVASFVIEQLVQRQAEGRG